MPRLHPTAKMERENVLSLKARRSSNELESESEIQVHCDRRFRNLPTKELDGTIKYL